MTKNENECANTQLAESLSALVDGQASELEVRRILKQLDELPGDAAEQLLAKWQRYHQAGDLIRTSMSVNSPLTASFPVDSLDIDELLPADHQQADFLLGVRQGIDSSSVKASDSSAAVVAPKNTSTWQNFAVAATVTLAVMLGVNQFQSQEQADSLALEKNTPSLESIAASPLLAVDNTNNVSATIDAQLATQLDAGQAQKRLNDYLLQHANHASQQSGQGMMPFARMTSFEQQQ